MDDDSQSRTSITLLQRVSRSSDDPAAWDEFDRQYRPKFHQWCRGWGVQEADAEDVTQLVLSKLLKVLGGFKYDPTRSFRGWLKTVARHVWSDLRERPDHVAVASDSLILSVEAHADLQARLEATYDFELLELAMNNVRARVEPTTWEAFQLTAIEGLSAAEAAQRLVVAVGNVYVAKHRVQKLLQQEIADLEQA
jgi:RNA polymerase sigma factor (sigma-70 family)